MDCSRTCLSVPRQLPEFTQTQVHWVSDAIQPSHPLSSLFPHDFNLSQYQGLFQWVSSSHQVAKVLEFQLQHQSVLPMNILLISFRMDWLDLAVRGTLKSLPVHHRLPESTQTRVHWVGDAIQPPHPLSSLSPPAFLQSFPALGFFQMSQLFMSGGQSIGTSASASVSPSNEYSTDFL